MLKKVSKITALVLCAALVVAAAAYPAGLYLRGNLDEDKYPLPQAFPQWIGEADGALADGADTRLMTSNVQVHYGKDWGGTDAHMRARMFFALLDVYQPDVVGIQEMSGQWHAAIARNGGSYEMLYQFTTGLLVRMTSMIYNTDTLELIDQGQFKYSAGENPRLRRVVWGVFERKDNGKRFAVTSTHFSVIREGRAAEARAARQVPAAARTDLDAQLQEAYGGPAFLLGDYNSRD
ncbi:MAG: hypothetical protein LIO46_06070, partial [Clostridiales bacterium]|nr:hypothetical protein [Clostridiales bacterium]